MTNVERKLYKKDVVKYFYKLLPEMQQIQKHFMLKLAPPET
jgi:hypothetical protein